MYPMYYYNRFLLQKMNQNSFLTFSLCYTIKYCFQIFMKHYFFSTQRKSFKKGKKISDGKLNENQFQNELLIKFSTQSRIVIGFIIFS